MADERDGVHINSDLHIAEWEIRESFIRASGPGGQAVNKVSSAVQLRWNPETSSLPPWMKARFATLFSSRITASGDVIIEAKEHRSQALNRDVARKRLAEMISKAAERPKRRIRTRPSRRAVQRRIDAKKVRSTVKDTRRKPQWDD